MIILTGASGGIGKELLPYLCEIDDVLGLYNSSMPENKCSDRLTYEKLNIECPQDVENFVEKYKSNLSRITLIHCAAAKIDGLAVNYSLSDWDQVMNVNLRGNFILTKALLPYMLAEEWGRVIHVSSKGGIDGDRGTLAYSASKTGLLGMSRVLGKEYARFHITSNVLVLGTFETGMFLDLPEEQKKKIIKQIPSKAFGNVNNIVSAVDFLIKSEYVTSSVINIDGGM